MSTAGPQHVTAVLAQYGTGVLALSGHSDRRSSRPQANASPFGASGPAELESAFAAMVAKNVSAVVVLDDATLIANAPTVAKLALQHRLPSSGWPDFALAGGLMAYGVDFPDLFRRAATFVDKILKGAKPTDLPGPKFEMIVNLPLSATATARPPMR
jgi:hypothetical protein